MSAAPRSVFISFVPGDRAAAERIHGALTGRGFATWMAPADLSGDELRSAIIRAIGTSTDMVMVFSAATNGSEDAKRELALAAQHHLTIIPVKVEGVAPNDHFAYELATATWIDASQNFDAAINQIAAAVGAGGVTSPPSPAPVVPALQPVVAPAQPQVVYAPYPQPKSHVLRHVILTGIALIVLVVGGFGAWVYFGLMPKAKVLAQEELACNVAKDSESIIADCTKAISDPNHVDEKSRAGSHSRRAIGYMMKKDYKAALADLNTVIDGGNWVPRDFYLRSVAERQLGQTAAAEADLAKAGSYKPDDTITSWMPDDATPASPAPANTAPAQTPSTTPAPDETPAPDTTSPDTTKPDDSPSGDTGTTEPTPDQTPPRDDGTGSQSSGESRSHN